jgi:hypothetical protein
MCDEPHPSTQDPGERSVEDIHGPTVVDGLVAWDVWYAITAIFCAACRLNQRARRIGPADCGKSSSRWRQVHLLLCSTMLIHVGLDARPSMLPMLPCFYSTRPHSSSIQFKLGGLPFGLGLFDCVRQRQRHP